MANTLKIFRGIQGCIAQNITCRFYAAKKRPIPIYKKLQATKISLESKGFLRPVKSYNPPADVTSKVNHICSNVGINTDPGTVIENPAERFSILNECFTQFKHGVPNSALCTIQTVGDIEKFYNTPVDPTTPLDAMKAMDLPKNLHVQFDYARFNPETDTMFNGITAFPKTSNLVTGLKYKKKYPGFKGKLSWY